LAKQGKLNQQQIVQVRHDLMLYCSIHIVQSAFFTTSYGITQTSTNPRRQSRCVDRGEQATPPYPPSYPISSSVTAWPTNPVALACTYPPPRVSPLGAEDDDGRRLNGHAKRDRERDLEGRLPDQHHLEPDQHGSCLVADGRCGTSDANRWHDGGSHSR
jgi:hypothetical protein